MKRTSILVFAIVLASWMVIGSATAQVFQLGTAWQPEHETFIPWYANQKGWDKEEGFQIKDKYFDSGMAMLEALPAKQWVIGGLGGVPMTVGAVRYGSYLIAIANDESITNVIMVRGDSPILKTKGFNKQHPEVYGKPEDIKGKTILCTTVSSAHYVMSNWLKVLGLKDKDVVIKNMDQAQAVAAFESGVGDAVALWAPHLYDGLNKGWKIAADLKMCGVALPVVLIGEKEFCDKNPEMVAKFLRVFFRGVNHINREGDKLLPEYKRFYKEWAGMEMSDDMAKKDLVMHPIFTYEEQLKLFDSSKGPSTVQQWQSGILEFFTEQGRFKPEDREKVLKTPYITDKFLKMVKQPIP
jgi:NitT/TauT family transport system substrate-binding protein/sulfonate transport system substrate-binding protein